MKTRMLVTLVALCATLTGTAAATTLAPQPGALVLRKGDFPAAAKYRWGQLPAVFMQGLDALGVKATGAYAAGTISVSSTKYKSVTGTVLTTGSAAQAKIVYKAFKDDLLSRSPTVQRLPSYGDEQIALLTSPRVGSKVDILVRRNTVVWQVEVLGGGLLTIPKATLLADLKAYAAKQKSRVGRG